MLPSEFKTLRPGDFVSLSQDRDFIRGLTKRHGFLWVLDTPPNMENSSVICRSIATGHNELIYDDEIETKLEKPE